MTDYTGSKKLRLKISLLAILTFIFGCAAIVAAPMCIYLLYDFIGLHCYYFDYQESRGFYPSAAFGILGFLMGIGAIYQIEKDPFRFAGAQLAKAGMILSVVGIIAAILSPVFS